MSLVETLKDESKLRAVVRDGVVLIDSEIASKRGLRAAALKAGYRSVKAIKPGIIEESMAHLLPAFAPAIDPHYQSGVESGDLHGYFRRNAEAIADSLLSVTDDRAKKAKNRIMLKVYNALRGQAKKHTQEAVPKLSGLIEKHV